MRRTVLAIALVLAALTAAQPAAAAPAPLRVSSISPAVADRGELVTIAGGGFGAHNLEVSVGGEPVELVSATGSRASFRVPALGAVGDVQVEARNPGGHSGRIGLRVRFDGATTAVVDAGSATSVPIGNDGGTIGVAGMTLAIPAGAVPEGTTITATPLLGLTGSPFAGRPVGLKLEPSGLVLLRPATLTLPKPAGPGTIVGFGFDGDGADLHLVPSTAAGDAVELKVWHFSGAGTIAAAVAELATVFAYAPTPAHMLAEHRIATALALEAAGGAAAAPAIFTALSQWWISSVLRGLQVARDAERLDFFELGFGEWQAWEAFVAVYDDNFTSSQNAVIATSQSVSLDVATQAAARIARRVLTRCVGPGVPRSALRDVLRLASAVNMAELPIDQNPAPGVQPLPSGGGLARACVDVRLLAFTHAPTFARNRDNRFTARAEVVFWSGPASSTVPLRYRLRDATGGPTPSLASGTSATGTYEDTVTPAGLGSRHYELTVDLDSTGGDTILAAIFDRRTDVVPVRERLDLQARRPGDAAFADSVGAVAPGGTVVLRIRLAGDDVAGKTITLTKDGNGTIPPSATTDASGEATVSYTAPASAQIELVNATITEGAFTSGDAVVITTREPIVVTVTPSFGFVNAGGTLQLNATVTGTPDTRISWNVSGGGTISGSGLFTAGSTAGIFTVTAVSLADPSSTGTAFVQVSTTTVEGRYTGTGCRYNDLGEENCASGFFLDYVCIFQSNLRPGTTTCGWSSTGGFQAVPNTISFCFIETDGTTAGGAFTGRVTFCRFRPASVYDETRIEGTIGNGRLEIRVYAPGFFGIQLIERFTGTKAP